MNRDHKIITLSVTYDTNAMVPDPDAPGSGEMTRQRGPDGALIVKRVTKLLRVVATDPAIAIAHLSANPFRFPCAVFKVLDTDNIDAVVETHTF